MAKLWKSEEKTGKKSVDSRRQAELDRRTHKGINQPSLLSTKTEKGSIVGSEGTGVYPSPGMPTTTRKKSGPGGLK